MPDQPHRMFHSPTETRDLPPAPTRIIEKLAGFMVSKTLFTAIDVGLFAAAGNDGATVDELAERCGIPARSARALADLLTDEGLLIRDGARFRNAADAELFLTGFLTDGDRGCRYPLADALGDVPARHRVGVRQQDRELLAPIAGDQVTGPDEVAQPIGRIQRRAAARLHRLSPPRPPAADR
jgi:hypothetical protein